MQSNAEIGDLIPTKDLDFKNLQQSQILSAVLGPKAGIQMTPNFVSLPDLEDVSQGKKHLFLWGWVVYHDAFTGVPRLSEYCFNVQSVTWTKKDHSDPSGDIVLLILPAVYTFASTKSARIITTALNRPKNTHPQVDGNAVTSRI